MTEYWKDVKGYEGLYQVSNLGNINGLNRVLKNNHVWKERILKPCKGSNRYLHVRLYKNGKVKTITVHRLVAEAFIPNPLNLPQVNHKDEDKTNNLVSNLEWCDCKYNINYGRRNEKASKAMTNGKKSKTVLQLRKDGSLVRIWPSASEVHKVLNYSQGHISECCRGERHLSYGYKWCYAN